MIENTKKFLELCQQHFPSTRSHQSHNLSLREGQLVLTLMLGDTYQMFNLNESDLTKSPEELLFDVIRLFKRQSKPRLDQPDEIA
jgi:hypothetical protein